MKTEKIHEDIPSREHQTDPPPKKKEVFSNLDGLGGDLPLQQFLMKLIQSRPVIGCLLVVLVCCLYFGSESLAAYVITLIFVWSCFASWRVSN